MGSRHALTTVRSSINCCSMPQQAKIFSITWSKKAAQAHQPLGHGKQKMSADLVQSLSGDASLQGFISHLWTSQSWSGAAFMGSEVIIQTTAPKKLFISQFQMNHPSVSFKLLPWISTALEDLQMNSSLYSSLFHRLNVCKSNSILNFLPHLIIQFTS